MRVFVIEDLLKGRAKLEDLPVDVQSNLKVLLERLNILSLNYQQDLKINDGYRRPEDQPKNAALASKHLIGAAVDIDDDNQGTVWNWVFKNLQLMKGLGLWIEHPNWTHNVKYGTWIHFQTLAPRSGNRIFIPSKEPDPNPKFWNGVYDKKFN